MKLMRADKRDAIVAAALYSAMFTFGVTYSIESSALQWERERFAGYQEASHSSYGHVMSMFNSCNRQLYELQRYGPVRQ